MEKNVTYRTEKNGVPNPASRDETTMLKFGTDPAYIPNCLMVIWWSCGLEERGGEEQTLVQLTFCDLPLTSHKRGGGGGTHDSRIKEGR